MTPREKVISCLSEIVGNDLAEPMADRHIKKYLMEKGKDNLTEEDMSNSDFGTWLVNRLTHLSMVKPQTVQAISEKLKGS